ncbi:hypothetical protein V2G26_006185 [Clonostachys chloroleuca]|jgi:hypothetical protein|uniref:LysM domain-containing protein n=4 Tax=Clonostachys TaxID=110564 RepID=A0A0B7JI89_BIOOC|nr:LysM1 [Clonostachys rosea]QUF60504.1 LysM1 [Clonostachys rhizophaga]QUF60505.1 LysM1 [Clonostachys chloroleuca]CAG9936733.1 unnamed protein product [Clonostachys rosea f. rosea IK726]CAH0015125.1 unnamed protein product [Clonostachys rhizophaga]
MSRFSQYDTDEERLPEGMSRVGYDADTEVYTFKDADGSYWESAPGNRYGRLTRVGEARVSEDDDDAQPFLGSEQQFRPSWRAEMMPLLNFFILVGLFLVFLFWYLHSAAKSGWSAPPKVICQEGELDYTIASGDTCWDIAHSRGITVDDLVGANKDLDCDRLKKGSHLCLPQKPTSD